MKALACRSARWCRAPRPCRRGSCRCRCPRRSASCASGSSAIVMRGLGSSPSSSGVRDRLVAQLLAGVGGVGDQLAQEHVLVGIDRMHHQVQKLCNIGLEGAGLAPGASASYRVGHGASVVRVLVRRARSTGKTGPDMAETGRSGFKGIAGDPDRKRPEDADRPPSQRFPLAARAVAAGGTRAALRDQVLPARRRRPVSRRRN